MTQTWWLSFCDGAKPTGTQFLGVVIVDVDAADVGRSEGVLTALRARHGLPPLTDARDQHMAAAIWKTHRLEINPGGEVLAFRIDEHAPAAILATAPRNRLLQRLELTALGLRPTSEEDPDAVE
jgi:hypothetical protein